MSKLPYAAEPQALLARRQLLVWSGVVTDSFKPVLELDPACLEILKTADRASHQNNCVFVSRKRTAHGMRITA